MWGSRRFENQISSNNYKPIHTFAFSFTKKSKRTHIARPFDWSDAPKFLIIQLLPLYITDPFSIVHTARRSYHPIHGPLVYLLLIAAEDVALGVAFGFEVELAAADVAVFFAREVLAHILLAQEVGLSVRLDDSLVVVVFAFELSGGLADQEGDGNHYALVPDAADGEVGEACLDAVNSCVRQSVAQFGVAAVGGGGSDGVGGVQVLDGQSNIFGSLGILAQILNHKLCEIKILFVSTLVHLILLDSELLPDNLAIVIHEPLLGSLRHYDHAVPLGLGNLDHVLVDAVGTVELEVDFGDEADVDVAGCQGGEHGDVTAVTTHEPYDADAVLGGLGFG